MLDHASLFSCTDRDLWADPDQAHVWRVDLDLEAGRLAALERFLSPEEHARAARFRSPGDRRRFVAARGSLRAISRSTLRVEPRSGQLRLHAGGEADPGRRPDFSTSICPTRTRWPCSPSPPAAPSGIDVERLRTDFEPEPLAKRFSAPSECEALSRVPPAERPQAFLRLWTLKEAYLKAPAPA